MLAAKQSFQSYCVATPTTGDPICKSKISEKITTNIYKSNESDWIKVLEKRQGRSDSDSGFILKINDKLIKTKFEKKLDKIVKKQKGKVEIDYKSQEPYSSWTRTFEFNEGFLIETHKYTAQQYHDLGGGIAALQPISQSAITTYQIVQDSGTVQRL